MNQWCGLRPSVLGQDWSETKTNRSWSCRSDVVTCYETRSCHARRHNDLEGHNNFSSTIYSFSIVVLEHHYCGDQQWHSLAQKLNPPSAFVYFRWSWSCYFGLGLKSLVLFTSLLWTMSSQPMSHQKFRGHAPSPQKHHWWCTQLKLSYKYTILCISIVNTAWSNLNKPLSLHQFASARSNFTTNRYQIALPMAAHSTVTQLTKYLHVAQPTMHPHPMTFNITVMLCPQQGYVSNR